MASIYCLSSTGTHQSDYRYLQGMVQDMTDIKLKHCGIEGGFCVDDFRDAMQAYRRHMNDLKTNTLVTLSLLNFVCCISHSALDPFIG